MSGILAKEKEALAKEEGKLKKFLKALQKFLAKEFLWVCCVALLAIPIAYLGHHFLWTYGINMYDDVELFFDCKPMLLVLYLLSILGLYFTRMVADSIALATKKVKK